ncbi:protein RGF1 INDUCIBLE TRANSCRIPTION FACTOR 1 isoform X3 [Arachis hypogaea]|uniref:protein RGF1 INDUCIBLE TRANSCRIPTION FACTOR 1 isoform X3 n=1 Tax=Arachis hypogaea TaxID=3818 RepID=UPI003B21FA07
MMGRYRWSSWGEGGGEGKVGPAWLEGLMRETFFGGCGAHQNQRKNEKNVFCLHCCLSICPHCLPFHRLHPLLQVRRYVYHDVVRLDDLEKLIDCSNIQPYTINSAKVIFLNQRPQSRSCKGSANSCFTCDRILQEPFHFCSLSCKFEGLRVDGSEVIDEDSHFAPTSSYSNTTEATSNSVISCEANNTSKKNKGKATRFLPGIVLSLGNRRKGAPHRAPLS